MRRRLAFLSLAVASLVVVAFLFPVAILIRNQAHTRALSDAERDVQSVATALAVVGTDEGITPELADAILTAFGEPDDLSVIFVSGEVVGSPIDPLSTLDRLAAERHSQQRPRGEQRYSFQCSLPMRPSRATPWSSVRS